MIKLGKTTVTLLTDMAVNPGLVARFSDGVILASEENCTVWDAPMGSTTPESHDLTCFKNVPSYMDVGYLNKQEKNIHYLSSVKGYTIALQQVSDVNQYMVQQFNKKSRGNILRGLRRLEDSYELSWIRYYGDINKQQCEDLLALLKEMIVTRFEERKETSHTLKDWESIRSTLYGLILEKKASLFVSYHQDKPIAISVAYHYHSVFFYYIAAFDITYSKFGLGNTMLYKQLEWSIANDYKFFEMGWGDLDYKRRWSNRVQPLVNHYVFPKKSVAAWLRFTFERNKSLLITYLISIKVNLIYRRVRNLVQGNSSEFVPVIYELTNGDVSAKDKNLIKIDTELAEFSHLKTILNDYIYTSQESYKHSEVVRAGDEFYIRSKKSFKRIILQQF